MSRLIAKLFGGKQSPAADMEPAPGIGGRTLGAGPANQSGFPGSTSQVRTFPGRNPVRIGAADWTTIKAETNYGLDQATGTAPEVRQASYRGEMGRGGGQGNHPRATPAVAGFQTAARQAMQNNSPAEFFGGPMLKTGPGNNTAGGYINRAGAARMGFPSADARETTTPWVAAQPDVSGNVPGSGNVRNEIAQRYKNRPGEMHTYLSAPRADQAPVNPGGQATDGNVHPGRAVTQVTVPNRYHHEGVTSWSVLREMPYGGRGDGARGADLNGQRYYAAGQADQFANAGTGGYGIERQRGNSNKRPVSFTQPAPWSAQFYDTTSSVGTTDNPNQQPGQQPAAVYTSPGGLRARNSTGRTG